MLRCDAVHPGISICTSSIEELAAIIMLLDYYSNLMVMATGSIETSVALYFYQTTWRHAHKVTAKKDLMSHMCDTTLIFRVNSFGVFWGKIDGSYSRRMKKEMQAGDNYI